MMARSSVDVEARSVLWALKRLNKAIRWLEDHPGAEWVYPEEVPEESTLQAIEALRVLLSRYQR